MKHSSGWLLQVDLLLFDSPQGKEAVQEHHMTADKGVWHHKVSFCPSLSLFFLFFSCQHMLLCQHVKPGARYAMALRKIHDEQSCIKNT